jgi:LPS O-antigen subunit length determinant protein (WzzB/FepE family)
MDTYKNKEENNNINPYDDGINLVDFFFILWKRKFLISFFIVSAAISSVFYAVSLPNIYTSSALLTPSNQQDSLSSKLQGFSAIAGLAGVNIPQDSGNSSTEAIARIKSFNFFSNYFLPQIKPENLVAATEWIPENNIILYDKNIYNQKTKTWANNPLQKSLSSTQKAFKVYKSILSINKDAKTSFITISIDHPSPIIAKEWVEKIISGINNLMKEEDRKSAENSISFLNDAYKSTNNQSIRDGISSLLESQIKTLMLASSDDGYVFKVLDSPIVPEKNSAPGRALLCILGTLLGGMLGVMLTLFLHFFRRD